LFQLKVPFRILYFFASLFFFLVFDNFVLDFIVFDDGVLGDLVLEVDTDARVLLSIEVILTIDANDRPKKDLGLYFAAFCVLKKKFRLGLHLEACRVMKIKI
jgi:hypothetical protein